MTMENELLTIEKNLYHAVSVLNLARIADSDVYAIDIDSALELASQMIESERERVTNILIDMYPHRTDNVTQ